MEPLTALSCYEVLFVTRIRRRTIDRDQGMENSGQPMHPLVCPAFQGSVWSARFNWARSPVAMLRSSPEPKLRQALAALSAFFVAISCSVTPLRAQGALANHSIQIRYFVVSCPSTGRPCADEPYLANSANYVDSAIYFASNGTVYFFSSRDSGVVVQQGQKSGIFKPSEAFTYEVAVSSWTPLLDWSYSVTYRNTMSTYRYRVAVHDRKCSLESIESKTATDGKESDGRTDYVALTCRIVPGRNPFSLPPLPPNSLTQLKEGLPPGFESIPKVDLPKR